MVPFLLRNAPLIVYGLAMLGGFYFGYKRGFFRSVWHVLFHAIRIAGAFFLTKLFSEKAMGFLFRQIQVWTAGTDFYPLFADETISHLIQIPVQMVANLVLFVVFLLLLGLVCKPLEVLTRAIVRLPKKKWKWLGGVVGVASGFLIVTAFIIPFGGAANLGHSVAVSLSAAQSQPAISPETTPAPVLARQVTEPVALSILGDGVGANPADLLFAWDDSFAMRINRKVGGDLLFGELTKVEYNGKSYQLAHEVKTATKLIVCVQTLSGTEMENWTQTQVDAMKSLGEAFGQSELLPQLTLSLINTANENWTEGKPFLGLEKPQLGEVFQPSLDLMLNTFATGTEEDLKNSITTVTNVMELLHENDAFNALASDEGADAALELLGQENLREELTGLLQADNNLRVCVPEMFRVSIRITQEKFGLESVDEILLDIADAINTVKANPQADTLEQKRALLAEGIQALSVKHHLEVPATATQYVAAFLIEQFDAVPSVTPEVIDNWLNHYAEDILANGIPENIQQWIPSGVDPSQLLPPQP